MAARRSGRPASGSRAASTPRGQPRSPGRKRGLCAPLARLRRLIGRGLERTGALWPDIERAYTWVHAAAHILENAAGEGAAKVRRRFDGLTAALRRHRALAGTLEAAIAHFIEVTHSCRPGLFHCYAVPGLSRTDNDLEQAFGAQRYHERRATGRKSASPAAVLRGEVRLIAATATRRHAPDAADLARTDGTPWRELRGRLDQRRQARTLRTRFRRDPQAYLRALEQKAIQLTLPA